ncbi:MAG TPA: hypothetical protein VE913_18390 [Longimicrobium sp.]|nr:hypothetical protein [Longimicrobium sp.]
MKNPILSVHIYKTGGTTFRNLLATLPGATVHFDYGDMPLAPARPLRMLGTVYRTTKTFLKVHGAVRGHDDRRVFIHGHFVATKYNRIFPSAALVTWLRDPVERVVSHYHFWHRHPNMKHPICKRLIAERLSLAEFAEIEGMRNVHSRLLGGANLASFDFVGITEDYDRSVALFLKIFAPGGEAPPVAPVNQYPERGGGRYDMDEEVRGRIAACNELDIALYEVGQRRFEELCEVYGCRRATPWLR